MKPEETLERMANAATNTKVFPWPEVAIQAALRELVDLKWTQPMDRMVLATAIGLAVLEITELEL